MEFTSRRFEFDAFHRFSKRIRSLSASFTGESRPRISNRILAPVILTLGLFSSAWAYHLSGDDALQGWLHSHLPSATTWTAALAPLHYERVGDPKLLQKLYRSIPSSAEPEGSVWRSEEGAWIAVFSSPNQPPLFFRGGEAPTKPHWQPLGKSWQAFDQAFQIAQEYESELEKRMKKPHKISIAYDPREIRY